MVPLKSHPTPTTGYSPAGKTEFSHHGNVDPPGHDPESGEIKKAAAISNREAQRLPEEKAAAIIYACDEIIAGKLKDQFIVDGIQGGAGTSANMNANEVIANRAIEILGGTKGDYTIVHPNDHVNMAQSTNDVIPSAGKLTVLDLLPDLLHALESLHAALLDKSQEFDHILKMGRTQLEDAVPMRLGQSFHAYATMIERDIRRIECARKELFTLNLGGTAIGTTINASDYYLHHIVPTLAAVIRLSADAADDLFDRDGEPRRICDDLQHVKDLRRQPLQDVQRPAPAVQRTANRIRRDQPAADAERILDYAGQDQPGDPGGCDTGCLPCHRKRHHNHDGG